MYAGPAVLVLLSLSQPEPGSPSNLVGVHFESPVGRLDRGTLDSVQDAIVDALEGRSGRLAAMDVGIWDACVRRDRCVAEIAERTRSSEVLIVQLVEGATKIRVELLRHDLVAGSALSARVDLPLSLQSWRDVLSAAVADLFGPPPQATPRPAQLDLSAPPPEDRRLSPWAIAAGSVAVVAIGVGIGFGASSRGARSSLNSTVLHGEEFDRLSARADGHALAANVLFGVAGAAFAGAVTALIVDGL